MRLFVQRNLPAQVKRIISEQNQQNIRNQCMNVGDNLSDFQKPKEEDGEHAAVEDFHHVLTRKKVKTSEVPIHYTFSTECACEKKVW